VNRRIWLDADVMTVEVPTQSENVNEEQKSAKEPPRNPHRQGLVLVDVG